MAKLKKHTEVAEKAQLPKWRNRIVGHGEEDAEQLLANPRNWRIHPKNQQDALIGVLTEEGWVQDIIVNKRTGFVVDGHARVALAISAGERVPVVYVDLSEQEEALILATLDPLSAMAATDEDLLAGLVGELDVSNGAVKALLAELGGDRIKAGLTDADACPEPPVTPGYDSRRPLVDGGTPHTLRGLHQWRGCESPAGRPQAVLDDYRSAVRHRT